MHRKKTILVVMLFLLMISITSVKGSITRELVVGNFFPQWVTAYGVPCGSVTGATVNLCTVTGGNYPGDVFVNTTGDVMTGDLNGTNFCITGGVCLSNVSAAAGGGITDAMVGAFVNRTGDYMSGALNISHIYANGTVSAYSGTGYVNITAATGDINISNNATIQGVTCLDSARTVCMEANANYFLLTRGAGGFTNQGFAAAGNIEFCANAGSDGGGPWDPCWSMNTNGVMLFDTVSGTNREMQINAPDDVRITAGNLTVAGNSSTSRWLNAVTGIKVTAGNLTVTSGDAYIGGDIVWSGAAYGQLGAGNITEQNLINTTYTRDTYVYDANVSSLNVNGSVYANYSTWAANVVGNYTNRSLNLGQRTAAWYEFAYNYTNETIYYGGHLPTWYAGRTGFEMHGDLNITSGAEFVNISSVTGMINASKDVCIDGGYCLGSIPATMVSILDDLGDVSNITYTAGHVLAADGSEFMSLQLAYSDLSGIGVYTPVQIDAHIDDTTNPHTVTTTQIGAVDLTTGQSIGGVKTFTSIPVGPATNPSTDNQLTRKAYVDATIAGLTWKEPVINMSTSNGTESTDPANPSVGDRYRVNGTGFGNWSGYDEHLMEFNASRLWESDGTPATGWTVLALDTNYQWRYDSVLVDWIQVGATTAYTGSLGVKLDAADFQADVQSDGGLNVTGNSLALQFNNSIFKLVSGFLGIATGGITNDMLAGAITDDKLNEITTADKVNASAVNKTWFNINDLSNVNTGTPSDADVLTYDLATGKWLASASAGGAGAGSNQAIEDIDIISQSTDALWRNMPEARTEIFGSTAYRTRVDFTGGTEYRLVVSQTVAGETEAKFELEYSLNNVDYFVANATGPSEVSVASVGVNVGAWATLATGAKGDVYLRVIGLGGDNADPRWRMIRIQVKVNVSATINTSYADTTNIYHTNRTWNTSYSLPNIIYGANYTGANITYSETSYLYTSNTTWNTTFASPQVRYDPNVTAAGGGVTDDIVAAFVNRTGDYMSGDLNATYIYANQSIRAFQGAGYVNITATSGDIYKTGIIDITTTSSNVIDMDGGANADYDFGYWLNGQAAMTTDSFDGTWLRLNQNGDFTSGIYTPDDLRVGGELRQGSTDYGAYELQTTGQLYVSDYGVFPGGIRIGTPLDPGSNNLFISGSIRNTATLDVYPLVFENDADTGLWWDASANRLFFRYAGAGDTAIDLDGGDVYIGDELYMTGGNLNLNERDTPGTCGTAQRGWIYYDISETQPCFCDGTAWREMDNELSTCT